jgi:hypothetical protein
MNKAFVREPDDTGERACPQCGSRGLPVGAVTLKALLPEGSGYSLSDPAWFCPYPKCEVGYFDLFERTAPALALARLCYPKDPSGVLCSCFGLTLDDVESDVREGVVTRVKALLARSKSPEAHCVTTAPDGRSCMTEVQRYYMKFREGWKPST